MTARGTGLFGAAAAAAALGVALAGQHFEGLVPCALCLLARWPYRVAILAGLIAAVLPPRYARYALWLLLLCFLADLAVGVTHVGVELGLWQSPLPECRGPDVSGLTGNALLDALPSKPITPCDQPVYLIPGVKLSMAKMNLLYAALVSVILARWTGKAKQA